jgi:hypothetical protein
LGFFVELLWLHRPTSIQGELVFLLHLDVLAAHFDIGLALVNANEIVVRVKVVESRLGQTNLRAVLYDDNVVFRVQFGYLHCGFAFVQPEFRIGQAG